LVVIVLMVRSPLVGLEEVAFAGLLPAATAAVNRLGPATNAAELDAGFKNPSHFARMFRKFVGTTPSNFQSETHGRD
jgi:methylphosphotriester-DNA--protein-cysteine methyltransferase